MPVGDAVYRLEADAGGLEQLVLRGVFPMGFSTITLVVMFGVLVLALVIASLIDRRPPRA